MTFPFGAVVTSSLNGRIDTALHIVPAGALEVACMGTGCLFHLQELKGWQLLPSLLMKFLFSLAGGGWGTSTFSHPRFYSLCVPEVARPAGVAHGSSPSLGPGALIWSRVGGVAGWKHRAALEWGGGEPAVIVSINYLSPARRVAWRLLPLTQPCPVPGAQLSVCARTS